MGRPLHSHERVSSRYSKLVTKSHNETRRREHYITLTVEQFMAVESHAGWDMSKCYLITTISQRETAVRGSGPISAKQMTAILNKYAKEIGELQAFSMHSFRSRGAVSRAFSRRVVRDHYAEGILKNPKTTWRYVRLLDVLAPGSGGEGMVTGISETQYREFNQFPRNDQSKSWAAFGNQPLL